MSSVACRGPVRFLLLAFILLWLIFLAYLATNSEARSSLSSSSISFSSNVLEKIRDVFNGTRFRHEPEKLPIIWSHRDPAFSRLSSGDIIHVELTTSSASLGGAIATINSVHLNTHHAVRFYIFAPDDGDTIQHLSNWISETHLKEIDYEIIPFNTSLISPRLVSARARSDLTSPMNFARFFTPAILVGRGGGTPFGRLVHLDDDVIVQGDIVDLWNQTIDHLHWGAFSNECTGQAKHSIHHHLLSAFVNFKNPLVQKLKIKPGTCAMNTGVYVVDLFYWMKHNISKQLDQWLTFNFESKGDLFDHQREIGYSGPPMMLAFHDNYRELDPLWHVHGLGESVGVRHSKHYLAKARLLHWSGVQKPWGRIDEGRDIWDTYYLPDPWGQFKVIRRAKAKSSRLDDH